ncbi:MAG: hypothetical protein EZS28_006187 [Streblomastix strix]|uniref:Transmembrane protein n=1 Tax=Streblomastix strix TaxID=222440 RepID=A0A5J4WT22_9EUKA|nr:MAG: hypothetical protein EZS28_006187 [Streblomastix strix]
MIDGKRISGQAPLIEVGQFDQMLFINCCTAQQSSALYFSISFDNFDHSLPPSRPMNLQIIDSSIISFTNDQYFWGGMNQSEVQNLSNKAAVKVNGAVVVDIINSTFNFLQDAFLIANDGSQVNADRLSKLENNGLRKDMIIFEQIKIHIRKLRQQQERLEAKLYDDGYESEGKWFKVKEQDVITPVVVDIPSETKKKLNTTSIVIIVVFSVIALIALQIAALFIIYCFCITKMKDKDNKQIKVKQIEIKDSSSEVSVKTVSNEEEEEFAQLVIERDQLIFNKQQSDQGQMQQQTSQNQKQAQRKVTRYKKTDFQAIIQEAKLENEQDEVKKLNENVSHREHIYVDAKKNLRLSRKKPVQSRNLTSKSAAISVQATDENSVGRYSSESMSEVVQRKQEVEEEERQD